MPELTTQLPLVWHTCSRHDNGITQEEVTADISPHSLEKLKTSFYENKVVVTRYEAELIKQRVISGALKEENELERPKLGDSKNERDNEEEL